MSELVATPAQRRARVALIGLGVALLGLGGVVLLLDVPPRAYPGILLWFAGAIVVHDLLIAPAVFAVSVLLRRLGRRLPGAVLAIVQAGIVVVAVITAIVVPEILKKDIGSANPTILPLDYAQNLVVVYGIVGGLTLLAIVAYLLIARRQKPRPPSSHD